MFLLLCAMVFRAPHPHACVFCQMAQCAALSIAAQCIAHRSVLHRPLQRSAFFTTLFCRVQSCGLSEAACRACLFLPACCKAREKALGQERNRCSCGQLPQCGKTTEALALVFLFAQSTNVGWWEAVGLILPHSVHFAPIAPSGLSGKSDGLLQAQMLCFLFPKPAGCRTFHKEICVLVLTFVLLLHLLFRKLSKQVIH